MISRLANRAVCVLFSCLLAVPVLADDGHEQKEVLLLCSFSLDVAAYEIGLPAFKEAIRSAVNGLVVIHVESMGLDSFTMPEQRQKMLELYRDRYSHRPLDVVAFVDEPALEFGIAHADEIAPNARKMFFPISKRYLESLEGLPAWSGVTSEMDVRGSLRLAIDLHPEVRRVTIVSCQSDFSRFFEAEARSLEGELAPGITFEYLSELRYEEMLGRLGRLPELRYHALPQCPVLP